MPSGQGLSASEPPATPVTQTSPVVIPPSTQERLAAIQQLLEDEPLTLDEARRQLALVEALAQSKDRRSQNMRKLLPLAKQQVANLTVSQDSEAAHLCTDRANESLAAISDHLTTVLHDPSSLQDLHSRKCVPYGGDHPMAQVRVTYRAKNTYSALVLESKIYAVFDLKTKNRLLALPKSEIENMK